MLELGVSVRTSVVLHGRRAPHGLPLLAGIEALTIAADNGGGWNGRGGGLRPALERSRQKVRARCLVCSRRDLNDVARYGVKRMCEPWSGAAKWVKKAAVQRQRRGCDGGNEFAEIDEAGNLMTTEAKPVVYCVEKRMQIRARVACRTSQVEEELVRAAGSDRRSHGWRDSWQQGRAWPRLDAVLRGTTRSGRAGAWSSFNSIPPKAAHCTSPMTGPPGDLGVAKLDRWMQRHRDTKLLVVTRSSASKNTRPRQSAPTRPTTPCWPRCSASRSPARA